MAGSQMQAPLFEEEVKGEVVKIKAPRKRGLPPMLIDVDFKMDEGNDKALNANEHAILKWSNIDYFVPVPKPRQEAIELTAEDLEREAEQGVNEIDASTGCPKPLIIKDNGRGVKQVLHKSFHV